MDVKAGAASSTATIEAPKDPAAYATWRQTGKLPEAEQTTTEDGGAESTTESTASGSAATGEDTQAAEKGAPASEAGKKTERRRDTAEDRKAQLNQEIRDLLKQRDQLKTENEAGTKKTDVKTDSSTVVPTQDATPKPLEAPKKPAKPNSDDFANWDDYETARDKYQDELGEYYDKLGDYKVAKAREDDRVSRQRDAQKATLNEELVGARKRYTDFDQVAGPTLKTLLEDRTISDTVKEIIGISPVFADLLYTIGGAKADAANFLDTARTNPVAAIRQVVLLERLIQEELAKSGKGKTEGADTTGADETADRDGKGRFVSGKAPDKKVSGTPPPPHEVGGRGSQPLDKVEKAVKEGDVRSYREEMNRRDLERRKGR